MTLQETHLFAPTGWAVRQGDTIALLAWANVVQTNITATLVLRPNNGSSPVTIVIQVTTTSNRAQSSGTAIVPNDGVIDAASCTQGTPAIPQRGQCYVQCAGLGGLGQLFFADYVYAGHSPSLGRIVEPGPAGGPGAITRVTKAATAVGAGLVVLVVPTGAIWRPNLGKTAYVATATIGTRSVRHRWRDASGNIFGKNIPMGPTASQTAGGQFGYLVDSPGGAILTTPLDGDNVSDYLDTPTLLFVGYDLIVLDNAAIDVADTVALEAQVEEWVMPN